MGTDTASANQGFFTIDQRTFQKVCNLGLNPTVAYLIQAMGTGHSNSLTSWSIYSIQNRTGISRKRAQMAIKSLIEAGFVKNISSSQRPRYSLSSWEDISGDASDAELVWIPNAFVDGKASPLERLRQTGDVSAVRLAITLYALQDLTEDGGISRQSIRRKHLSKLECEYGEFNIWGFLRQAKVTAYNHFAEDHVPGDIYDEMEYEECWNSFWSLWRSLENAGVIEWAPHLVEGEGEDAEIIHPLDWGKTNSIEDRLGSAAHRAAIIAAGKVGNEWATPEKANNVTAYNGIFIPVLKHIRNVQLVSIARLRYRPHTKKTSEWYANTMKESESHLEEYEALVARLRGESTHNAVHLKIIEK